METTEPLVVAIWAPGKLEVVYLFFFVPVAEGLKFMLEVEDDQDWLQSDTTEDDEDSTRWAGQPFFSFHAQWPCNNI